MISPGADVQIDSDTVRSLLAAHHPDLADLALTHLDAGWDNSSWRLGDDLVVRLPRRAAAVPLAEREHRWLPGLAPSLPLPVPVPLRVGAPTDRYPWPWSVVPWLDGEPGDRAPVADAEGSARRLGVFLRALHQPAPADAPHNPYRGVPVADRTTMVEERMAELGGVVDVGSVRTVWNDACAVPPWRGAPVWLHGDLHPANVLVDVGVLAAVIDFGDICAGDPATDIAAAWMLLPSTAMSAFLHTYGEDDEPLLRRARGWAVFFGLMLLSIGLSDKPTYEAIGRGTLRRATDMT